MSEAGEFRRFESDLREVASSCALPLHVREVVDSTNDAARRKVTEGAAGALALVAWQQLRGRGRGRRTWVSPPGRGVYLTVFEPLLPPSQAHLVPLAAALAVAEVLLPLLGSRLRIKWPNDLVVGGRKLGGLLVESVTQGRSTRGLIGVGINVLPPAPPVPGRRVTALGDWIASPPSLAELVVGVVDAVHDAVQAPRPVADLLRRWRELCLHRRGDLLRVRIGDREIEGFFEGFDDDGRLIVKTSSGVERLVAGEVEP